MWVSPPEIVIGTFGLRTNIRYVGNHELSHFSPPSMSQNFLLKATPLTCGFLKVKLTVQQ